MRKAKVGGYRDYFDDNQVAELRAMVDSKLLPVFGYTSAEAERFSVSATASLFTPMSGSGGCAGGRILLPAQFGQRRQVRCAVRYPHRDYCLPGQGGQAFLRGGTSQVWHHGRFAVFTPLRFLPAADELAGRAVVTDPDKFAVGDVYELLTMDKQGHRRDGASSLRRKPKRARVATSEMLLDCAPAAPRDAEKGIRPAVSQRKGLRRSGWCWERRPAIIGYLPDCWNDFDHLGGNTRLLHNTKQDAALENRAAGGFRQPTSSGTSRCWRRANRACAQRCFR
ncbi:MAG: hypothetical protein IPG06_25270 [Haliea sp.]|nr:hypothetical protein [Haliea sp.]